MAFFIFNCVLSSKKVRNHCPPTFLTLWEKLMESNLMHFFKDEIKVGFSAKYGQAFVKNRSQG